MFETILIPADGSDGAKHAARFGRELAKRYNAQIDVLHVFEGGSWLRDETGERERKEQGQEIVDEIAELTSEVGIEANTHLTEGQSHKSIANHVDENDVDLVAMGRHGRSGLGERLLGTVTDRVLRQSNTPVLTVPDENTTEANYENILVTTDGSENAERAAPYGVSITQHVDATLHLLNVVDVQARAGVFNAGGVTDEFIEQLETEGQEAIEQLAQHATDADVTVQSSVERGRSYKYIDEYVTENSIDLIVIASEGKSNLASQTLGSVTDHVLQAVNVPVLVVIA